MPASSRAPVPESDCTPATCWETQRYVRVLSLMLPMASFRRDSPFLLLVRLCRAVAARSRRP